MKFVPKKLERTADVSRGKKPLTRVLEYAVGVAAFFAFAYVALGAIAYLLAVLIPDSWESKLPVAFEASEFGGEHQARLDRLLQEALPLTATRDLPYRIHLIDMEVPNAFATPGGGIWVTRALSELIQDDRELAFVIAHEMGHHHHRHVLKRMGRSLLFGTLAQLVFGSGSYNPGNALLSLSNLDYSRKQEIEADLFAHSVTRELYPDFKDAYRVLEKIDSSVATFAGSEYARTHPYSDERIRRIESMDTEAE